MKHLFLLAAVATFGMIAADTADARGLRGLFGGRGGHHNSCCSPCVQETSCCEPTPCCEQAAPCCEPDPCGCDSGRRKHRRHRDRGCCQTQYNDCGCGQVQSDCGCGSTQGGVIVHEGAAPSEASPSDEPQPAPEPPADGANGDMPPPPPTDGGNAPAAPEGGESA